MIEINREENIEPSINIIKAKNHHVKEWFLYDSYPIEVNDSEVILNIIDEDGEDWEATFDRELFENALLIERNGNNINNTFVKVLIGEIDEAQKAVLDFIVLNHIPNKDEISKAYKRATKIYEYLQNSHSEEKK